MDPEIMRAIEDALERQGRLIVNNAREISEGLSALAHVQLEAQRKTAASERVLMCLLALVARDQTDPLRFMETVRAAALDPLPEELDGMGDEIERILSKAQAAALGQSRDEHER